ncbi:hypothetical protein HF521_013172 [Silurus meridionalis]|uniref:Uncharacterized protein n=1 Tax=Silurus meridionalis TaxID=175797 RepID=A0A8T0AET2_SILME|nr:hypothetical protein HF521_013172 [Silurus meridionalis]
MSDIRHALLRRDPLSAAKEVLYHLDIALGSTLQAGPGLDKNMVELVDEFIFHVPKERNTQRKRMSCVQELQLLEIMCSYFQEQSKDAVRQVIFSALFSLQGNKADENRMAMLGKLVSMAVAVCRVPILECAATWLQVGVKHYPPPTNSWRAEGLTLGVCYEQQFWGLSTFSIRNLKDSSVSMVTF